MTRPFANFIGIDDGPFEPSHRGDVPLVGVVYTNDRMEGILTGKARKDGANGTRQIASMIRGARYNPKVVLLGGIAVGGFNVIDIHGLHEELGLPVLVVARRRPNMRKIERALLERVPGGARKWRLIQKAGPMEPLEGVWVQRAGIEPRRAAQVLRSTTEHGKIPEPLRVAHLIAGGLVRGHSRGRA